MASPQTELARELGLTRAAVSLFAKQGMPLDPVQARQWCDANLGAPSPGRIKPGETPDYRRWRAQRERVEALRAENRLREETGELVPAADVKAQRARTLTAIRDTFQQLPARLVPTLMACKDALDMEMRLRAAINAALQQISEMD
jgi:hypothetical protein